GHFPGHPIMPGVLIVEGMAQCAGVLMFRKLDDPRSKVVYFASIDKIKFRKPVVPGDQLRYEIEITRFGGKICKFRGETYVGDSVVCEAEMVASIMDK
ncbi:MAG: 3-hydroxyacyl-ACP dehydratase FabZ, partial [Spirochaetota bacterium]|nr:3-hydroxyacyl-ACP dehydratase FabZ [Spirochaetota bacterium]